ncbi:protein starmaker-like [Siniperca chuatsi]|uniref:protein starmaker-like n=1 Tax=Siniperca chuatsi TaxID=119488 RepID=UPI001CE07B7A|nr:protein starmaker-like [Siniperca chuatsi]XP_044073447.1 protein starmaker-like [Siniperca chuatsi]
MARYFMARYFMAYSIWTFCLVAGQSLKYVLKGLEVNLNPDITGHPDDILWKHNGNKVVEFDGKEQRVYKPYENRITLDWVSAELNITDLRFEDSGNYELEVYVNNFLHHSRFVLKVIDKVAKPNISCEMNDGSSSNISGKLLCSAEPRTPQSLMKFEWISHGNVQLGPELIISLGNKHDDEVYSCRVSNHLSSETAIFMAKDCYPDKSSVVVAVTVVAILLILLVICIAVFFYLRHRKGKSNDLENQSQHGSREDKTADQEVEKRPLMNSDLATKHKEDGDSHQITVEPTEKNSPGSGSSTDIKETESDGSKEEADEDEEAQSAPASAETSTAQPCFPLTKSSPNMAPKDTAGEHKEKSDSDQVTGETVRESDSSGIQQKINESDDFSKEKQSSTIPEQKGSEIPVHEQDSNLSQEETHTRKDNQQETDKPVSEDENKSDSVGDGEEKEKEQDLYLATSQQPQSPVPTKPDNRNTFQESPDTAHADPDREEEGKTRHDSDESEGQPNSSTEDADKDKTTDQEEEKRPLMNSDLATKHKEDGDSHQITVEPTEKNSPGSGSSTDIKETESDGSKEEADEDEEAQSAPASAETSTAQPCFPLTKSSPNMAPKDTAGEHKEKSDSDQVTGETVRESDSSGIQQKINESDDFSKEKQSSTIPEQKGSEIPVHEQDSNLSQEETHTRKDNQQETDKPVSEDENKSDSVGDGEEKEKEQDLYLATSQQPQSPVPTKPDNRNTFQESPDTAHADPDREEEGKTRHDSDESEGQPDSK